MKFFRIICRDEAGAEGDDRAQTHDRAKYPPTQSMAAWRFILEEIPD
jgi:hypothetical protein